MSSELEVSIEKPIHNTSIRLRALVTDDASPAARSQDVGLLRLGPDPLIEIMRHLRDCGKDGAESLGAAAASASCRSMLLAMLKTGCTRLRLDINTADLDW